MKDTDSYTANKGDQDKKDADNSNQEQKVPRVRRIVGAQVLNEHGVSVPMNILNSSNPNDLQAQLALFLQK